MTIKATIWAMSLCDVSPEAKLVAIALSDYFNEESGQGTPVALTYLAEFACCSPSVVREALLGELHGIGVYFTDQDSHVIPQLPVTRNPRRAECAPDPQCDLYVIAAERGAVKVGIAACAQTRLRQLQFAVPEQLRLVFTATAKRGEMRSVEAAVHAKLVEHRIVGEWFRISQEDAVAAVRATLVLYGVASK